MRRILAGLLGLAAAVGLSSSTLAYAPSDPSDPPAPFVPWRYSSQLPYGPFEDGTGSVPERAVPGAFLTLPFEGSHLVTSIFDHCGPNYILDGVICRYDGAVAHSSAGADWRGYARSAGAQDFLYYDGHDGWDYSLYYEPVLAAAAGTVSRAGWDVPGCETCSFGQNVFVDHGNGFSTRYAHLSQIWVHVGETVARGQVLGISGNTGASTGEHLHFGVYRTAGLIPIDPYGWAGAGADPWPYDEGDLWLGGAPRFPSILQPSLSAGAEQGAGAAQVSWQGAGAGGSYDVLVSVDGSALKPWLAGTSSTSASYPLAAGHSYWFLVRGTTALGLQGSAMTAEVFG